MPPNQTPPPPPPGIDLGDLVHMAFRHKWKIAIPTVLGVLGAAAYFLFSPPIYESDARLLVRYLVERSAIDSIQSEVGTSSTRQAERIIQSEIEILTSWDLATDVVRAIGVARILDNGGSAILPGIGDGSGESVAVRNLLKALDARAPNDGNVIHLSFRHSDPSVATEVLEQLVKRYFDKHLEIHRSAGTFEFVSRQADQVRSRLRQTEDELKKLKAEAGIVSLEQTEDILAASIAANRDELLAAETALAEQAARLSEIEHWLQESAGSTGRQDSTGTEPSASAQASTLSAPAGVRQDYMALVSNLSELRRAEVELSAKFTATNPVVLNQRAQLEALEQKKADLERRYPSLAASVVGISGGSGAGASPDVVSERAHLAAVRARAESLKQTFTTYTGLAGELAGIGAQIRELERRREIEETNYKYYEQSLERARIDEALDPSKIPNIGIVQSPSPALRVTGEKRNILLAIVAAGLALGGGLAFVSDKVLDRTIRRRFELESHFGLPQLLTIPNARTGRARALLPPPAGGNGHGKRTGKVGPSRSLPAWDTLHHIRPYADAVRSRLIHFFHVRRLAHKPKLVAVTGVERGAGTSTLASALAASFSETGDGKVLLISMDYLTASIHPFMEGRPAFSLTDALETGGEMRFKAAERNLYLATATVEEGGTESLVQQRLYDLLPQFRASDFDYIVFDLPPATEASPTLNLAGFMDKTLLVVEAGRTNRDELERVLRRLRSAEADVAAILNKYQPNAPVWLPMAE